MGSVLVVEDDEDLSTMLATIIEGKGHEVRTAGNGLEALARVAERMPDLILLDVKMPVMDGRQFASQFRSIYGHAARLVVMTAAESAAKRAEELSADSWLAKPFDSTELSRVLSFTSTTAVHSPEEGG